MFLPTTLESTDKIVETIEELKVKIPSNPLEADILAMAEMIAEAEELDKASSDLCGMFHPCLGLGNPSPELDRGPHCSWSQPAAQVWLCSLAWAKTLLAVAEQPCSATSMCRKSHALAG